MAYHFRFWLKFATVVVPAASLLKLFVGVDLTVSALTVSAWIFFGFLITFDDFFPGEWSNPDGKQSIPYGELLIRGLVFLTALSAWAVLRTH